MTLINWRAKRAGGRITVYGEQRHDRSETRITNVDMITPGPRAGNYCIATTKTGETHHLALT